MVDHDGGYKRLFSEPRMVQSMNRNSPPLEGWREATGWLASVSPLHHQVPR
jgi:hypothetical protein